MLEPDQELHAVTAGIIMKETHVVPEKNPRKTAPTLYREGRVTTPQWPLSGSESLMLLLLPFSIHSWWRKLICKDVWWRRLDFKLVITVANRINGMSLSCPYLNIWVHYNMDQGTESVLGWRYCTCWQSYQRAWSTIEAFQYNTE